MLIIYGQRYLWLVAPKVKFHNINTVGGSKIFNPHEFIIIITMYILRTDKKNNKNVNLNNSTNIIYLEQSAGWSERTFLIKNYNYEMGFYNIIISEFLILNNICGLRWIENIM